MRRLAATRGLRRASAATIRTALATIALALGLLAAGCNVLHKEKKSDPLFGEHLKDTAPAPAKTGGNVPPIPSASTSSNAAMALATLPGGRQLAIGEPERPPMKTPTAGTLTSAGPSPAPNPAPGGGTTLSQPQPVVVPVPREADLLAAGGNREPSSEYLLSQLRARGVSWHRADSVAGGIRFACIVPNRQNPSVTRIVEATAPDFPSAVNAVLQQIDNQH